MEGYVLADTCPGIADGYDDLDGRGVLLVLQFRPNQQTQTQRLEGFAAREGELETTSELFLEGWVPEPDPPWAGELNLRPRFDTLTSGENTQRQLKQCIKWEKELKDIKR